MIYELGTYLAVFIFSMAVWLPIYKYVVSDWVQKATISRIESGEIDLNYLLDEGGVFDTLAVRTVTLFKQHMLAEMGNLSKVGSNLDPEMASDPVAMGVDAAGELLKMVGMKKPPAMLQLKVAQALGQMAQQGAPTDQNVFDPSADFYKQ
jgi:hypothetical protein